MFEDIALDIGDLGERSGYAFQVTESVVDGTDLFVVYCARHPFPADYEPSSGVLGFRVPSTFPDACPEDTFFLQPSTVKLKAADPVRNSTAIHRASCTDNFLKGTSLGTNPALTFSWHIWDRVAWHRKKHTLFDHYTHCLRRFDQPEHD